MAEIYIKRSQRKVFGNVKSLNKKKAELLNCEMERAYEKGLLHPWTVQFSAGYEFKKKGNEIKAILDFNFLPDIALVLQKTESQPFLKSFF